MCASANAAGSLDAWRVVRWLRRELDEFKPDIVQSMLWHANMMTAGALWLSKVPWVAGMRVSEPRSAALVARTPGLTAHAAIGLRQPRCSRTCFAQRTHCLCKVSSSFLTVSPHVGWNQLLSHAIGRR